MHPKYVAFILTAATSVAWPTNAMAPLRWLVVALHEGGHIALIAITRGQLLTVSVSADGGMTRWDGGIDWLILSAGYLTPVAVAMALMTSRRWWWWAGWLLASAALRDIVEDAGRGDAAILAVWTGSALLPSCAWVAAAAAVMALGWRNQNWK